MWWNNINDFICGDDSCFSILFLVLTGCNNGHCFLSNVPVHDPVHRWCTLNIVRDGDRCRPFANYDAPRVLDFSNDESKLVCDLTTVMDGKFREISLCSPRKSAHTSETKI